MNLSLTSTTSRPPFSLGMVDSGSAPGLEDDDDDEPASAVAWNKNPGNVTCVEHVSETCIDQFDEGDRFQYGRYLPPTNAATSG